MTKPHPVTFSLRAGSLVLAWLSLKVEQGRGDRDAGMWDSGTQGLGRGDACMGGSGDVGALEAGTWRHGEVGTQGCGDVGLKDTRSGTRGHQDRGRKIGDAGR